MWSLVMHKLALLALLAACSVGEVPLDGVGTPDAAPNVNQQSFMSTIQPLVTECVGCHSAATPPNLTSFSALDAKYKVKPGAMNILVTKAGPGAVHQGVPYFTEAEKTTVGGWIDGLQ